MSLELTRSVVSLNSHNYCITHVDAYSVRRALRNFRDGHDVAEVNYVGGTERPTASREMELRHLSTEGVRSSLERDRPTKFWGGLSTLDDADALFQGWDEGAKDLEKFATEIQIPHIESIATRFRMRRKGPGRICASNVMRGRLDQAYRVKRKARVRAQGVIELAIAFGGNCGVTKEEMFWQAAAGLATARTLQQAGYRVGLSAYAIVARAYGGGSDYAVTAIRVVEPGTPISIETVAAVTAHCGIYRTAGFVVGMADLPVNLGQSGRGWELGASVTGSNWTDHLKRMSDAGQVRRADINFTRAHSKVQAEELVKSAIESALGGKK